MGHYILRRKPQIFGKNLSLGAWEKLFMLTSKTSIDTVKTSSMTSKVSKEGVAVVAVVVKKSIAIFGYKQ